MWIEKDLWYNLAIFLWWKYLRSSTIIAHYPQSKEYITTLIMVSLLLWQLVMLRDLANEPDDVHWFHLLVSLFIWPLNDSSHYLSFNGYVKENCLLNRLESYLSWINNACSGLGCLFAQEFFWWSWVGNWLPLQGSRSCLLADFWRELKHVLKMSSHSSDLSPAFCVFFFLPTFSVIL